MPISFQAARKADLDKKKTVSQSTESNMSQDQVTVEAILKQKGQNIFTIQPKDTLNTAVQLLSEKKIGALVVTDKDDNLQGIISERDIVRKLAETPGQTLPQKVKDVMTAEVETCSRESTVISVMSRMTEGRFRHMPVLENGQLIGIVTIGDVVNHRLIELEYETLKLKQLVVG